MARRPLLLATATAGIALAVSSGALGASSGTVFWSNYSGDSIAKAALDGSGGSTIVTSSNIASPWGTTINPLTDQVLFASDATPGYIKAASLSGANPQALSLPSGAVTNPYGISFAPSTGRVYWANYGGSNTNTIRYAAVDGSAQGTLYTAAGLPAGALDGPLSVQADPASGRIYWFNGNSYTLGYANLDGSGGGGVITFTPDPNSSCSVSSAEKFIVDSAGGKIYLDSGDRSNLDGSNCEAITSLVGNVNGLALDIPNQRLYYVENTNDRVRFIDLASNSSVSLATSGAVIDNPAYPVLYTAPDVTARISGTLTTGSTLTCEGGAAPDVPGVNLYRSARTTTYAWKLDGAAIAGETGSTLVATKAGSYVCSASATNVQGSGSAESDPATVTVAPASGSASGSSSNATTQAEVKIPEAQARAGLRVSAGGTVRLPLSCPSGLPGNCDANGDLTMALPRSVQAQRGPRENASRIRVLARFAGVEIASGTTRLYTVRLAPKTYNALRKAGIRRVPATLRVSNSLAGGEPVVTRQRVWLKILPLAKVAVTG